MKSVYGGSQLKKINSSVGRLVILSLIGSVFIATAGACSAGEPDTANTEDGISVISTIPAVHYLAEYLVGELGEVETFYENLSGAHFFEPGTNDIVSIKNADLLLYVSDFIETWIADLEPEGAVFVELYAHIEDGTTDDDDDHDLDHSDDLHTEDGTTGDDDGHDHSDDLHIWLVPMNMILMADTIRDQLVLLDQTNATVYNERFALLEEELIQLDSEFKQGLATCQTRTLIVSHAAFGHLADEYGFEQVGISNLSDDFEISTGRLQELFNTIDTQNINTIAIDPSDSDEFVTVLERERSLNRVPIHDLESFSAGYDYPALMRINLQSIRTALGCSG